jgi:MFS family permease
VNLGAYGRLLRAPQVGALIGCALLARLPNGFSSLALLILVRERTGSYLQAGIAVGVASAGAGVAAPVMGRLVDRVGQTRVLVPTGLVEALAFAGLAIVGATDGPAWLLLVLAGASGLATAPVSASLRALWSDALPEGVSPDTAYSLESTTQELIFIVGPLLAAGVLVVAGPAALLGVGAVLIGVGTMAFASLPPSRRWRPHPQGGRGHGALANAGVRTLVAVAAFMVASFVFVEVTVVAFARDEGFPEAAGVLLAVWAAASLTGGVWHGARHWTTPPDRRILLFAAFLPLGFAPLIVAPSLVAAGFLIVFGGIAIAPFLACVFALVGRLTPEGSLTEAFSWLNAAFVAGAAAGAAVAGALVDGAGTRAGFIAVVVVSALCPLLLVVRRASLRARP